MLKLRFLFFQEDQQSVCSVQFENLTLVVLFQSYHCLILSQESDSPQHSNAYSEYSRTPMLETTGTRNVIRETWASGHNNVFFVLGTCCHIPTKNRVKYNCERKSEPSAHDQKNADEDCLKEDQKIVTERNQYGDVIVMDEIDEYVERKKN